MNPAQLVCHARLLTVKAQVEAALDRARQGDPQILPVVGPTRVGKSMLFRAVSQARDGVEEASPHEVVYLVSPKHLTGRALPDACLASIGLNPGLFGNHVAATTALVKALQRLGTRALLFDEAQHVLERGSSTTVRAAADFFKLLFDQAQVSLVLGGLPSLLGLFQANEQLADRARRPVEFYPYDWQGPDYRHFREALAAALEGLNEAGWETFAYDDAEFAQRMYVASAGRYGLVHRLVAEVQADPRRRQAGWAEFAQAYDATVASRWIAFNPFDRSHAVAVEHRARVYAGVLQEAGARPQEAGHAAV